MRGFVEGVAEIVERIAVADVKSAAAVEAKIVDVLRDAEESLPFDGVGGPSGDFGRELFKRGERSFATSEMDGVGYVGTRVENRLRARASREALESGSPASCTARKATRVPM